MESLEMCLPGGLHELGLLELSPFTGNWKKSGHSLA